MDVGNSFYMMKCVLEVDRKKVMEGGPWMIFDHYLAVQTWSLDFPSPTSQIEKTMVQIRFPGVNMMCYDESVLMMLVEGVGQPIQVNVTFRNVQRSWFAHVCVEVDLSKPVISVVGLCGHWYKVEYEGLHIICSFCERYGPFSRLSSL